MVRNYKRKTEDRWSKEDLLEALVCIKEAKLKINDAARQYGISRATLYRQYQKFILAGGKCDVNQFRTCGGNPILTKVEEDVLEKTIRDLREQGFTVTSSDIKRICFEYCDSNGIPNQFNQEKRMASDDWYYGFLKRHPDVRISKPGGPEGNKSMTGTSMDVTGEMDAILATCDNNIKSKKSKSSPSKKSGKSGDRSPSKSPVHVIPLSNSSVTESQAYTSMQLAASSHAKGKKQHGPPVLVPQDQRVKKPLKRLSGKAGGKGRSRKSSSKGSTSIPVITAEEYVKSEMDEFDEDEEEQDEQEDVEVMETEAADDDEEEEEEDVEEDEEEDEEEEQVADEDQDEEVEDVEMAEDDGEEQEEAEKSESDEEEDAEEEEAEADEDEEEEEGAEEQEQEDVEEGEEQEDVEDDADNDAEEAEAEEDEEDDEEEDEEEEEDEDNGVLTKPEKDDSASDCTNDDDLLDKLLDM